MQRKAKIICTIGPAVDTEAAIEALIAAGMDVARMNFSHGDHASHLKAIETIRRVSARVGKPIAILQDLQGPKIRIGMFEQGCVDVVNGDRFIITTNPRKGDASGVSTPYTSMPGDVYPGSEILLHDGLIKMEVEKVEGNDIHCIVVDGGMLYNRSGICLPGVRISEPSLTAKDKEDLIFGLKHKVDYVALSFVRDADDLDTIHDFIREHAPKREVPVVAKLETAEAVGKLDDILAKADAVMVARGDLGVEISAARVPVVQKDIIERCHRPGLPVITATQMLDSMAASPTPTRAEASDVANAVFDGSDAVMLSVETAFGKYPLKSVETMAAIIREAETRRDFFRLGQPPMRKDRLSSAQSICRAAYHTADGSDAKAIVCATTTGISTRLMSKYRPEAPIIGFSRNPATLRRMALYWGVIPMHMDFDRNVDDVFRWMMQRVSDRFPLVAGDRLVITSGASMTAGGTNLLRLYTHQDNTNPA